MSVFSLHPSFPLPLFFFFLNLTAVLSDVQSLHNRLQIVESQIAQIFAGGLRAPTALASVSSDNLPFPHNEHTMLAVGSRGSSVTLSLDDVAALWLEHLDFPRSYPTEASTSSTPASSPLATPVQLEPCTTELAVHDEPSFLAMIPSFNIYYPTSISQAAVTPSLIALLPSASTVRSRITTAIEETMKMHPCFNVKHFRTRAESMFVWAKEEDGRGLAGPNPSSANAKADLARSIFFPSSCPPPAVAQPPRPAPTLSFFASVSVAYALGVLVCKENETANESDAQKPSTGSKIPRLEDNRSASSQKAAVWNKYSASGLFALSRQAMAAFEMAHTYDLDSVITYLLQILYLLHDSRPRVAHIIYPLLGKVINIALMMGLSTDPDEFPAKYSLFEAEQRRRIWWDIYYYDV
jgi:Fungal specific transcription factor domain